MFYIPRPVDKINSTIRDVSNCTEIFPGFNSSQIERTADDRTLSSDKCSKYVKSRAILYVKTLENPTDTNPIPNYSLRKAFSRGPNQY